jgi:hypothetical protein
VKYAIVILAHHKPWLMMGSLITLAMQGKQDYDLHIVYIQGDGECPQRESYSEYHDIVARTGEANPQLSEDEEHVLAVVRSTNFTANYHIYENDHGLDSGAWFRFVRDGIWENYDYIFCFMEGFLFTSTAALPSVKSFINEYSPDFIDVGHEQRALPRALMESCMIRSESPSEMDYFHQRKIQQIYEIFCEDAAFDRLYQLWQTDSFLLNNPLGVTYHYVPDRLYSLRTRVREYARHILKKRRAYWPLRKVVFAARGHDRHIVPLKQLVGDYYEFDGVVFFREESPYFFGCSCQHIFSRKFLSVLSEKLKDNDLYRILDIPYFGTPLEQIWGMMPAWLGFDKWVFNGEHRPRKNFITLSREDDQLGVCQSINRYYKGLLHVEPHSTDRLRVSDVIQEYKDKVDILGDCFIGNM